MPAKDQEQFWASAQDVDDADLCRKVADTLSDALASKSEYTHRRANKIVNKITDLYQKLNQELHDRELNDRELNRERLVPLKVQRAVGLKNFNLRRAMKELRECMDEAKTKLANANPAPYPDDYSVLLTKNERRWKKVLSQWTK